MDPKAWLKVLLKDAPVSFEPTPSSLDVLESRYLARDRDGRTESPDDLFFRVARTAAEPESLFGGDPSLLTEVFRLLMTRKEFLPNSPTLMNAGKSRGQLSGCFVLPTGSSMRRSTDVTRQMTLVQETGGGTGFNFSDLETEPVSMLELLDKTTDEIRQAGVRRGANMGILRVDHPAILSFITAKLDPKRLTNFNLSVGVNDSFMVDAHEKKDYPLLAKGRSKPQKRLPAHHVLDLVARAAWMTGEPGVVFFDAIERCNPTPQLGRLLTTNPCGEIPLLPYESCNLGSLNLSRFVRQKDLDWHQLEIAVWAAVRFLDDIIEANIYPIEEIGRMTRQSRKIGLGVMGFADALILLGVGYNEPEALDWAERIMSFISIQAKKASSRLASERGPFPAFPESRLAKGPPLRNATVTSIAPTGTLSILAGCSAGIEPLFGLALCRRVMGLDVLKEIHPLLEHLARKHGLWSHGLRDHVEAKGTLEGCDLPLFFHQLLVTAHEVPYTQHVKIQAAFQRHVDNSVSKTVNLPKKASPEQVRRAVVLAWKLDCKGITVYRDQSRRDQVLTKGFLGGDVNQKALERKVSRRVRPCPHCGKGLSIIHGLFVCLDCAWSRRI